MKYCKSEIRKIKLKRTKLSVWHNNKKNTDIFSKSYFGGMLKIKPKKCDKIVTFINN